MQHGDQQRGRQRDGRQQPQRDPLPGVERESVTDRQRGDHECGRRDRGGQRRAEGGLDATGSVEPLDVRQPPHGVTRWGNDGAGPPGHASDPRAAREGEADQRHGARHQCEHHRDLPHGTAREVRCRHVDRTRSEGSCRQADAGRSTGSQGAHGRPGARASPHQQRSRQEQGQRQDDPVGLSDCRRPDRVGSERHLDVQLTVEALPWPQHLVAQPVTGPDGRRLPATDRFVDRATLDGQDLVAEPQRGVPVRRQHGDRGPPPGLIEHGGGRGHERAVGRAPGQHQREPQERCEPCHRDASGPEPSRPHEDIVAHSGRLTADRPRLVEQRCGASVVETTSSARGDLDNRSLRSLLDHRERSRARGTLRDPEGRTGVELSVVPDARAPPFTRVSGA